MKDETRKKLETLMGKAVEGKELAGGCLLVRQHGKECCYLEAGMADVEEKNRLKGIRSTVCIP